MFPETSLARPKRKPPFAFKIRTWKTPNSSKRRKDDTANELAQRSSYIAPTYPGGKPTRRLRALTEHALAICELPRSHLPGRYTYKRKRRNAITMNSPSSSSYITPTHQGGHINRMVHAPTEP